MTDLAPGMITENFSWQEAVITTHREITNVYESSAVMDNIFKTAKAMEAVRKVLDSRPISINSWYRNQELNRAVGGSKNSDHMSGSAVDFICPKFGSPLQICTELRTFAEQLGFKQLILEHSWVHISWSHIPNVKPKLEVLSLLAGGGYAHGLTNKYGIKLA